jgi:hypothetical protein
MRASEGWPGPNGPMPNVAPLWCVLGEHQISRGGEAVVLIAGLLTPHPRVVKGFDLGLGFLARFGLEQDVVGAVRVERRVEVDQVGAL